MRAVISLLRDRQGAVGITLAATITAMVLLMLAAIDLLRVSVLRSRVQAALDAAVLAVGYNLGAAESEWQAEGAAYFAANMGDNSMGGEVTGPTFTPTTTAEGMEITATASVSVPLMVSAFTQIGAMSLSVGTTARKRTRANVEMVLAIDNTGSMADSGKMAAARSAAKDVIATMLGDNSGGNTYVGLVPFNETVRVGDTTETRGWLATGSDTTNWGGCLFERADAAGTYAVENLPPTTRAFRPYRDMIQWDHETTDWWGRASPCAATLWNALTCKAVGIKTKELTSQDGCVVAPVQFLSASKATLDAAVDSMAAHGSTMVAAGVSWGWRMLSPTWRGQWKANSALPKNAASDLNKVLVLLTDGDNAVYSYRSWDGITYSYSPYGNPRAVKPWGDLSGDNNLNADNLLWSDPAAAGAIASYCEAAKAAGITIFTIPFGTSISTNTETIIKGCASSADKYFRVTASTDLAATFKTITDTLSELVIVQ